MWFSTASPAYLDKNNASTLHAALRLDTDVAAFDFGGALRSGIGALRAALDGNGTIAGRHLRPTRRASRRAATSRRPATARAALLIGDDSDGPVIAEYLGGASATEEFIERWRTPGLDPLPRVGRAFRRSEVRPARRAGVERGAEVGGALGRPGRRRVIVTGMHARAVRGISGRLGTAKEALADDRAATVGNTGSAHAALLLADTLEIGARPVR